MYYTNYVLLLYHICLNIILFFELYYIYIYIYITLIFRSSGMWCLRMWCLMMIDLTLSYTYMLHVTGSQNYYYQTPHPQTPHP